MSWVKWYKSPTAWVIIIAAVAALVGAFLCAYYLPYPLNLITAIACCVPSGIIIRKVAIKALIKKGDMKEIKAREGYYLTQVGNVGEARVYITALKGANIHEEDWREATEEEKLSFQKTQEDIPQQEI